MNAINLNNLILEACIWMYEEHNFCSICNDGNVSSFVLEKENPPVGADGKA